MSSYRYIALDSTYRNRILFPNPCEFVIPVSYGPSTAANAFQSMSPVADSYPLVVSTTQAGSTTTNIVLNASSSTITNFYNGSFLQLGSQFQIITAYNPTTFTATVTSPFSSAPLVGTTYYIRQALPSLSSNLVAGSTQNILNLGPSASSISGSYVGYYIYFTSGPNIGTSVLITQYSGTIQQATLAKALPNAPGATDGYDILQFTEDYFSPMIYSGTPGFNQPVCYSIELLYVTVPNQVLTSGYGGSLNYYPYLLLDLYNEGNMHSEQTIYSNNPNSRLALFKIPLGLNLKSETFFTLKDTRMISTNKFKPDQALHFKLYLPSGEPIIFATPDNAPPLAPNPLLQVSATFAIRRIDGSMDAVPRKK